MSARRTRGQSQRDSEAGAQKKEASSEAADIIDTAPRKVANDAKAEKLKGVERGEGDGDIKL